MAAEMTLEVYSFTIPGKKGAKTISLHKNQVFSPHVVFAEAFKRGEHVTAIFDEGEIAGTFPGGIPFVVPSPEAIDTLPLAPDNSISPDYFQRVHVLGTDGNGMLFVKPSGMSLEQKLDDLQRQFRNLTDAHIAQDPLNCAKQLEDFLCEIKQMDKEWMDVFPFENPNTVRGYYPDKLQKLYAAKAEQALASYQTAFKELASLSQQISFTPLVPAGRFPPAVIQYFDKNLNKAEQQGLSMLLSKGNAFYTSASFHNDPRLLHIALYKEDYFSVKEEGDSQEQTLYGMRVLLFTYDPAVVPNGFDPRFFYGFFLDASMIALSKSGVERMLWQDSIPLFRTILQNRSFSLCSTREDHSLKKVPVYIKYLMPESRASADSADHPPASGQA